MINTSPCSTKFAVEGLSEALALAVPKTGVRVTLVEPGATQTAALQRALHMLEQVTRRCGCIQRYRQQTTSVMPLCNQDHHQ